MTDMCCAPLSNDPDSVKMRMVYWYILETFPHLGRAPTIEEIERDLLFDRDQIVCTFKSLETKGTLRSDSKSYRILDAYPYSGVPTRHRISLDKGENLYSMCALDVFYIPFLTDYDLTVRSHCFHCRCEIELRIEQNKISKASPTNTVVWHSASSYDCPKTNFFCSEDHLSKWREKEIKDEGQIYTLTEALKKGKDVADRMMRSRNGLNDILLSTADELVCYCREVPKTTIVAAINRGISSVEEIAQETTACTGGWCKDTNPRKRCCCTEIEALIGAYSVKRNNNPGECEEK